MSLDEMKKNTGADPAASEDIKIENLVIHKTIGTGEKLNTA